MVQREAVIVAGARTAVATSFKGSLIDVDALELGTKALAEVVSRSGIPAADFDDVIMAESLYGGGAIARYAAIAAGLVNAPGFALNRHCAGGLTAVTQGAASILAGQDRVVAAGGVQSTSTSPRTNRRIPGTDEIENDWLSPSHPETDDAPIRDMSITVGWNAAVKAGLTRADLDAWALRSHQRAVAAIDAGAFKNEIFALDVTRRDGTSFVFDTDEHPRRDTTAERLAGLRVLHPEIEGFSITAGNAAGVNDGAGLVVVTDSDYAQAHGLEAKAKIRSWASAGVPAGETGLGPIPAIRKALARGGVSIGDIDLFEINEAFASVPVAACRELGLDEAKVNILGSGCSLGHPIAMTGARMILSMVEELRRRGGGLGVTAMCAGGGMGTAVLLEVPA